jgi:hypothetical protein
MIDCWICQVENGGQEGLCNTVFVEENRPASPPLHLATGLGIDIAGFGGSIGAFNYMTTDFADGTNTEEYYRMMVEEHPSDPLFLRNFAQFLLEVVSKIPLSYLGASVSKL